MRLVKKADGLLILRGTKGADTCQVNLGRVTALPAREVDRLVVEHAVSNGGLEIKLPDHAQAKPPAPAAARDLFDHVDLAARRRGKRRSCWRNGGSKVAPQSGVRGR